MAKPLVLYECSDGVALLTLNKPERLNAWSNQLAEAWFDAYDRAAADPQCRVIVVTGAGRAFCAGADMDDLSGKNKVQVVPGEAEKAKQRHLEAMKTGVLVDSKGRWFYHAQTIPKPIIAAVNGAVAGGGFSQMMFCDIRFAAEGAAFSSAFGRRGLIAEFGISKALPLAIGTGNAMDVMLSGRKFRADEALQLGIVQRIMPPAELLPATMAYARDVATNMPPPSMAVIKQMLLRHPMMPMEAVIKETNRLMLLSLTLPEFREGVKSFMQKRTPSHVPYDDKHPLVSLWRDMTVPSKL